jgi:hypothetical protein
MYAMLCHHVMPPEPSPIPPPSGDDDDKSDYSDYDNKDAMQKAVVEEEERHSGSRSGWRWTKS